MTFLNVKKMMLKNVNCQNKSEVTEQKTHILIAFTFAPVSNVIASELDHYLLEGDQL